MRFVIKAQRSDSDGRAFSLTEVVVALGIFAIAIVGVLGLLSPTIGLVNDTIDSGTASRLADTVNTEVERLGYNAILSGALLTSAELTALDAGSTDATIQSRQLFASRSGDKVCNRATASAADNYIEPADRFFEVVLVRYATLSPTANDATAGYLAFSVRVTWPAQVSDDTETGFIEVPRADRSVFTFNAAVRR